MVLALESERGGLRQERWEGAAAQHGSQQQFKTSANPSLGGAASKQKVSMWLSAHPHSIRDASESADASAWRSCAPLAHGTGKPFGATPEADPWHHHAIDMSWPRKEEEGGIGEGGIDGESPIRGVSPGRGERSLSGMGQPRCVPGAGVWSIGGEQAAEVVASSPLCHGNGVHCSDFISQKPGDRGGCGRSEEIRADAHAHNAPGSGCVGQLGPRLGRWCAATPLMDAGLPPLPLTPPTPPPVLPDAAHHPFLILSPEGEHPPDATSSSRDGSIITVTPLGATRTMQTMRDAKRRPAKLSVGPIPSACPLLGSDVVWPLTDPSTRPRAEPFRQRSPVHTRRSTRACNK